jgi:hypothetical protein
MGRPPLAVGTFGTIRHERLGRNRVQASASFRDPDGRRRHVLRTGPARAKPSGCCVKPSATAPGADPQPCRPTAGSVPKPTCG